MHPMPSSQPRFPIHQAVTARVLTAGAKDSGRSILYITDTRLDYTVLYCTMLDLSLVSWPIMLRETYKFKSVPICLKTCV